MLAVEMRTGQRGRSSSPAPAHQDHLVVHGREWYWLPPAVVSKSELDVRAIGLALGRGTTRTLTTVSRLHAKLLAGTST